MANFNATGAGGYYRYVSADSTEAEESSDSIQTLLNETGSEVSGLSHLDAPNDSLYMIGGVLIAMFLVGMIIILLAVTISPSKMVGSNGTMIAIRLVRSKLRKREEHSNSVHPADVVLHQTTAPSATPAATQTMTPATNATSEPLAYRGQFLWQYPPPPPQPCLYNNNQDALVQNIPTERPGFVRGFRKNLGGRWRRLVKRKPETEVYTIPAELKPQLKQIYVY